MAPPPVVKPTKHIRERVGRSGGVPLDVALERASVVVAQFSDDDLAELDVHAAAIAAALKLASGPGGIGGARAKLFHAAHEIRGQAATLGLPLAGAAADALCKFLDLKPSFVPEDLPFVTVHVQAIEAVIRQRLRGDGGPLGAELVRLLAKAREKRAASGA